MNAKETFQKEATKYGVKAGYSGKQKKMIVSGDEAKVKSFLRIQCLKGKSAFPFSFGKS